MYELIENKNKKTCTCCTKERYLCNIFSLQFLKQPIKVQLKNLYNS